MSAFACSRHQCAASRTRGEGDEVRCKTARGRGQRNLAPTAWPVRNAWHRRTSGLPSSIPISGIANTWRRSLDRGLRRSISRPSRMTLVQSAAALLVSAQAYPGPSRRSSRAAIRQAPMKSSACPFPSNFFLDRLRTDCCRVQGRGAQVIHNDRADAKMEVLRQAAALLSPRLRHHHHHHHPHPTPAPRIMSAPSFMISRRMPEVLASRHV